LKIFTLFSVSYSRRVVNTKGQPRLYSEVFI
jgi:hypothetical protein